MRDFMRFARHRYFAFHAGNSYLRLGDGEQSVNISEQYRIMLEFHARCERSSPKLLRDWDNIEELYTQADLCRLAGWPESGTADKICQAIAWVLWDIYRVVDRRELGHLRQISDKVREAGLKPVIITTNYDLVAELSLGAQTDGGFHSYHCYPGFNLTAELSQHSAVTERSLQDIDNYSQGVPIIKLHGSVNWFQVASNQTVAHSNAHLLASFSGGGQDSPRQGISAIGEFAAAINANFPGGPHSLRPEIIPPMLGKASTQKIIEWQWRAAIQALSRAAQIWIVGYSFPTTDAFMQRLLHEGLSANQGFDWLVLASNQPEAEWGARLDKLLNPVMRESQFRFLQQRAKRLWQYLSDHNASNWLESAQRLPPLS